MSMPEIKVPEGLDTNCFVLASGALKYLPELIRAKFPGKLPWLVADGNSWRVAGEAAKKLLNAAGFAVTEYIFPAVPRLHPD